MIMRTSIILLIVVLCTLSCKNTTGKSFEGPMRIYPLSPYQTVDDRRERPVIVLKFLIVEGRLKDMSKVKDTVIRYIDSLKSSLLHKNDTLTSFGVYRADAGFTHTYVQTHPNPITSHNKDAILQIDYKGSKSTGASYFIWDGKHRNYSRTPPPVEE